VTIAKDDGEVRLQQKSFQFDDHDIAKTVLIHVTQGRLPKGFRANHAKLQERFQLGQNLQFNRLKCK